MYKARKIRKKMKLYRWERAVFGTKVRRTPNLPKSKTKLNQVLQKIPKCKRRIGMEWAKMEGKRKKLSNYIVLF